MFLFVRQPETLERVWDGSMTGTFLCALRGIAGFQAHEAPQEEPEPALPTIGRVIQALREHDQPMRATDLAILLHDSGGDIAEALTELELSGVVMRLQPALFQIGAPRGAMYVLKGE